MCNRNGQWIKSLKFWILNLALIFITYVVIGKSLMYFECELPVSCLIPLYHTEFIVESYAVKLLEMWLQALLAPKPLCFPLGCRMYVGINLCIKLILMRLSSDTSTLVLFNHTGVWSPTHSIKLNYWHWVVLKQSAALIAGHQRSPSGWCLKGPNSLITFRGRSLKTGCLMGRRVTGCKKSTSSTFWFQLIWGLHTCGQL